jgi:hypothetical protein
MMELALVLSHAVPVGVNTVHSKESPDSIHHLGPPHEPPPEFKPMLSAISSDIEVLDHVGVETRQTASWPVLVSRNPAHASGALA